jgi:CheY-like chemotaxis protein
MLATRLLERRGHTVVLAKNGKEALEALYDALNNDKQIFDLVLMDIQMPEMDGLEATREIRRREQSAGRHVPIIALTANATAGDRERCFEAGMDGFIGKPLSVKVLLEAIDAIG